MRTMITFVTVSFVILAQPAQAEGVCEDFLAATGSSSLVPRDIVEMGVECLKGSINDYHSLLDEMEAERAALHRLIDERVSAEVDIAILKHNVARGAVLAFDRSGGCPAGWTEFTAASGRTIIGVDGINYKLPYVTGKPEYQKGGSAEHMLTAEEMPKHRHKVTSSPPFSNHNVHDGFGGSGANMGLRSIYDPNVRPGQGWSITQHENFMSEEGGSKAHNNMQPYIALYYCKKQ